MVLDGAKTPYWLLGGDEADENGNSE